MWATLAQTPLKNNALPKKCEVGVSILVPCLASFPVAYSVSAKIPFCHPFLVSYLPGYRLVDTLLAWHRLPTTLSNRKDEGAD